MMKRIMMGTAVAAALCGCTTVDYYREGEVRPQQGLQDLSTNPYYIDYSVENARKTGNGHSECWFWFFASNDGKHMSAPGFTFDSGLKDAKDSATYDAVEKAGCDTLMGAQYKYSKTSKFFGLYKCTDCEVIGFPAHVKSIKLIQATDRPVIISKDQQVIRVKPWEKVENQTVLPAPKNIFGF